MKERYLLVLVRGTGWTVCRRSRERISESLSLSLSFSFSLWVGVTTAQKNMAWIGEHRAPVVRTQTVWWIMRCASAAITGLIVFAAAAARWQRRRQQETTEKCTLRRYADPPPWITRRGHVTRAAKSAPPVINRSLRQKGRPPKMLAMARKLLQKN